MLSHRLYPPSPRCSVTAPDNIPYQKILTIDRIIQARLEVLRRLTPQKELRQPRLDATLLELAKR